MRKRRWLSQFSNGHKTRADEPVVLGARDRPVSIRATHLSQLYGLRAVGAFGRFLSPRARSVRHALQRRRGGRLTSPPRPRSRPYAAELFDEAKIVEVFDPEEPKRRYCLCRNPLSAGREGKTRERLLERTRAELDKIAGSKRRASAKTLGARVGRVLERS